ncbi:hypothetical protein ACLKA7_001506 [Drosophila subpalustris]
MPTNRGEAAVAAGQRPQVSDKPNDLYRRLEQHPAQLQQPFFQPPIFSLPQHHPPRKLQAPQHQPPQHQPPQ